MEKKIVISDMDGTLLDKNKNILPKTIETIEKMRDKNIEFTIATGRLYPFVKNIIEDVNITTPLILCNGALIQDAVTKEIYRCDLMDKNVALDILKLFEESESYFYYYTVDSINSKEVKYTTLQYTNINEGMDESRKMPVNITQNLLEKAKKDDIIKLVLIEEDIKKLEKIKESLKIYEDFVEITSSFYNNIEIVKKGCTKGNAVKFFAEKLGYDIKNIMCIGDEENDRTMLEVAGFSVAMGNANEQIKKIVDFVTDDNNSDGMSKAIIEFSKR